VVAIARKIPAVRLDHPDRRVHPEKRDWRDHPDWTAKTAPLPKISQRNTSNSAVVSIVQLDQLDQSARLVDQDLVECVVHEDKAVHLVVTVHLDSPDRWAVMVHRALSAMKVQRARKATMPIIRSAHEDPKVNEAWLVIKVMLVIVERLDRLVDLVIQDFRDHPVIKVNMDSMAMSVNRERKANQAKMPPIAIAHSAVVPPPPLRTINVPVFDQKKYPISLIYTLAFWTCSDFEFPRLDHSKFSLLMYAMIFSRHFR